MAPSTTARQREAPVDRTRVIGVHRAKTVPAFILQGLTGLTMLCAVAATILAAISILVPRLYVVQSSLGVSLPPREVFADPTNTSIMPNNDVVLMPDFTAYIGVTVVCYGGDWSCTNRNEHTFEPVPSTTIDFVSNDWLLPNVSNAVLGLTSGGPLDASLKRGAEACDKSPGRAVNLKNLLLLALCVGAVVSFLVLIPTTILQMRLIETERVVDAVDSNNMEFLLNSANRVRIERASGSREIFWIVLPTTLSLLSCLAMIAALVLLFVLEDELYCEGGDMCKIVLDGLRAFVIKWSHVPVDNYAFSCGIGAAHIAIEAGLAATLFTFLSTAGLLLLFHFGRRQRFLGIVQARIDDLTKQHAETMISVAHGVPIETNAAAPSPRRPSSPVTRPRSPSVTSATNSAIQSQRTSPVRAPPPPPPSKRKPLRSAAVMYSPRNGRSASPDEHDVLEGEMASIAQQRLELLVKQEAIRRGEILSTEKVGFVGSLGLIKRKAWRVERAVCLHDWCLDWYYGPLLDLLVEETFRRQELIRKWWEKLLDRCTRFPEANGEPLALKLVTVDDAMSWASPYRLEGDAPRTYPQDQPYSPVSRLRGLPYFEEQWRRIMDSPTRRFYDPTYGVPSSARRHGGEGSSVEVSSASDDDSPRHHSDLLMRTASPHSRVLGTPPRDRYSNLRESRELYPVLYSPRRTPNHSDPNPPLDFRAITKATDDLRKAYEDAIRKSSSRPSFDRGVNASRDAALDFQHAIARSQAGLQANPPTGVGVPPPTATSRLAPQPNTSVHWEDKPDASWGQAAVAQRLAELSKYTKSAAEASNLDDVDEGDLR